MAIIDMREGVDIRSSAWSHLVVNEGVSQQRE